MIQLLRYCIKWGSQTAWHQPQTPQPPKEGKEHKLQSHIIWLRSCLLQSPRETNHTKLARKHSFKREQRSGWRLGYCRAAGNDATRLVTVYTVTLLITCQQPFTVGEVAEYSTRAPCCQKSPTPMSQSWTIIVEKAAEHRGATWNQRQDFHLLCFKACLF